MICIILPAYDEEKSVDDLLNRIDEVMHENKYDYKIIFVNDGSGDRTAGVLSPYMDKLPIEVVTHSINRGLWETVRDGFERAAEICNPEDIIIRMDCDISHDPKYIPAMLSRINEGSDIVITSRFRKGGGSLGVSAYRNLISRIANLIMKMFFPIKGVWEYSCGYRAYKAELVQDALKIFENEFIGLRGLGFTCTLEKLIKFRMMKAKISEIPFILRYDLKESDSKMITSITTLGYLALIAKHIYPWGNTTRGWLKQIDTLNQGTNHWRGN
ncbi:glycosyltransferase family 2 protein [Chloroflexota bacterium]